MIVPRSNYLSTRESSPNQGVWRYAIHVLLSILNAPIDHRGQEARYTVVGKVQEQVAEESSQKQAH